MSWLCSKCGKECKDKKGLTKHENVCGSIKDHRCPSCNGVYSTKSNLSKHMDTCKVYKDQQIKEQTDRIQTEYEQTIVSLTARLEECKEQYFLEKKELIKKHREDCANQLKMRENDMIVLTRDYRKLEEENAMLRQDIRLLKEEVKQSIISERTTYRDLAHLAKNTKNSTVVQNISHVQTQQNFFLQPFNPEAFQGKINPPDTMICSISQLSDLLYDGGFGNYLRISDKSRNVGIWHKPGEGVIRDVKCSQITNAVIDSIISDLQKQKVWLEEELKRVEEISPDNHDRLYTLTNQKNFTTGLIEKTNGLIMDLQKELGSRARDKSDTTLDPIRYTSYSKIQSHLFKALSRNVSKWINLSGYELGNYLAQELEHEYRVEGGSFSHMFILVNDDQDKVHLMYEKEWSSMIDEGFVEKIRDSELREWSDQLLRMIEEKSERPIMFFEDAHRKTMINEILRGMIQSKRHTV